MLHAHKYLIFMWPYLSSNLLYSLKLWIGVFFFFFELLTAAVLLYIVNNSYYFSRSSLDENLFPVFFLSSFFFFANNATMTIFVTQFYAHRHGFVV